MNRNLIRTLCVLPFILILAGCNMALGSLPEDGAEQTEQGEHRESPDTPAEPVTGAKVTLPMVSNRLLAALGATYEPEASGELSSQAFLFGTAADITVYQDEEELYTLELTEDDFTRIFGDDGPPRLEAYIELQAGDGYNLDVEIYNSTVREDQPVVAGSTAEPFNVAAGVSTPVTIYGIPVEPDVLSTSASGSDYYAKSLAQVPFDFHEEGYPIVLDIGGEAWFHFTYAGGAAADQYARIVVDPEGTADAVVLTYNHENGEEVAGTPAEGMWDPPPLSWGFMPNDLGGAGGTRLGFMGPVESEFDAYMGVILLNREHATASEEFEVWLDIVDRPQPVEPYENAFPASQVPSFADLEALGPGTEETQTVFLEYYEEEGESVRDPYVHYFALDIPWHKQDLMDPLPITVEVTFDVLNSEHIWGGNPDGELYLALLVGEDDEGAGTIYTALDDPDFLVTENGDRTTTISFVADVDTSAAGSNTFGAIAISSYWEGNEFTVSWDAPAEAFLTFE